MKSKKKQVNPEIVVGDVAHKSAAPTEAAPAQPYLGAKQKGITKRKKVFVFVVIGILMFASAGWLTHQYVLKNDNTSKIDPELPDDYSKMSADQIKKKVEQVTGKTIEQLEKGQVSNSTFKNYDQAYAAAQAFSELDNFKLSLQFYAIADSKSNGKATYEFYVGYADTAGFNGNVQRSIELLEKAKSVLASDNKNAEINKELIDQIDQSIEIRKAEQQ